MYFILILILKLASDRPIGKLPFVTCSQHKMALTDEEKFRLIELFQNEYCI